MFFFLKEKEPKRTFGAKLCFALVGEKQRQGWFVG